MLVKLLWLGGKAVVKAETKELTLEILMKAECTFNNIKDLRSVVEISESESIIYNDNGNY